MARWRREGEGGGAGATGRARSASLRASAMLAVLLLSAIPALSQPAGDECRPVEPAGEIAHAQAAGSVILAGDEALRFVAGLKGSGVPIARADRVILSMADGAAGLAWIDDADSPLAIRCDWTASAGSPLAALIERTMRQAH